MATKKKSVKKKVSKKKSTKKKVAVKKKTATKKKTVKTVAPVPAKKRYFMLEIGGRGAEVLIGKSTDKFVEHWRGRDGELADHMSALLEVSEHEFYSPEDEDFEYPEYYDKDSPLVDGKNLYPYFEYGDIEHETGVDPDFGSYTLSEIELTDTAEYSHGELSHKDSDDDDYDDNSSDLYEVITTTETSYGFNNLVYSREFFIESDKKQTDKPVPVITMMDTQKGTFGMAFVETNGEDFDHNKLSYAVLETPTGSIITELYYDKKYISINTDYLNTWGKGFYADVGYIDKSDLKFNRDAWLKQGFKDLDNK